MKEIAVIRPARRRHPVLASAALLRLSRRRSLRRPKGRLAPARRLLVVPTFHSVYQG